MSAICEMIFFKRLRQTRSILPLDLPGFRQSHNEFYLQINANRGKCVLRIEERSPVMIVSSAIASIMLTNFRLRKLICVAICWQGWSSFLFLIFPPIHFRNSCDDSDVTVIDHCVGKNKKCFETRVNFNAENFVFLTVLYGRDELIYLTSKE